MTRRDRIYSALRECLFEWSADLAADAVEAALEPDDRDEWRADAERLAERVAALNDLLAHYRSGWPATERTHRRLNATADAVTRHDALVARTGADDG